jgi:NADH-quinone oxidoreductase subunit C
MKSVEEIKSLIERNVPGARVELLPNGMTGACPSLLLEKDRALEVAMFLRDTPDLRFDFASNVTGVDWVERVTREKMKVKKLIDGVEKDVDEVVEKKTPAYLEVVYHLYSIACVTGPLIIRLRTGDRLQQNRLPSLTPVWRSCEFQEREVFDLFGVVFDGHPDLRRLLMWDEFKGHPMRKDYVAPDDYEYEPTPHDDVLDRARSHYLPEAVS